MSNQILGKDFLLLFFLFHTVVVVVVFVLLKINVIVVVVVVLLFFNMQVYHNLCVYMCVSVCEWEIKIKSFPVKSFLGRERFGIWEQFNLISKHILLS